MVKIIYWKCDRCGKEIKRFSDIEMITLMKKTQEFCRGCSEDFKKWYGNKKGRKR